MRGRNLVLSAVVTLTLLTVLGVYTYRFDYSGVKRTPDADAPEAVVGQRVISNGLSATAEPLYSRRAGSRFPVTLRVFNSSKSAFRAKPELSEIMLELVSQPERMSIPAIAGKVAGGLIPEVFPARQPGLPEPFVQFSLDLSQFANELGMGVHEVRFRLRLESTEGLVAELLTAPVVYKVLRGGEDARPEGK